MPDRLADIAHGALCVCLAALAVVAWIALASLFAAGASLIILAAFIRAYILPVTVAAVIVALLIAWWQS